MTAATKTREEFIYRDSYGNERQGLEAWVDFNLSVQQPLLADAVCPAVEYNYAISEDGGQSFRRPTDEERFELAEAVKSTGRCCRPKDHACGFRTILLNGDYATYLRRDLQEDCRRVAAQITAAIDASPPGDDEDEEDVKIYTAKDGAKHALKACELAAEHEGLLSVELSEAVAETGKAAAAALRAACGQEPYQH